MNIKKMLCVLVLFGGLGFLYHTYYVRGSRGGFQQPLAAGRFTVQTDALADVVEISWGLIEQALVAKDYHQKMTRMEIPAQGQEEGFEESELSSRGINKIPGAQEGVKKIIADAVTTVMREHGALVATDVQQVVQLSGILQRIFYTTVWEYYSRPQTFDWCPCITIEKRVELAVRVVLDVCKQHKPDERLRYTSIATGGLLQDYIILQELKERGFHHMTINVIDPGYFELGDIEQLKKISPLPADKQHADYLLTIAERIDELIDQAKYEEQEEVQALRISLRKRRDRAAVLQELQQGQAMAGSYYQDELNEQYDRFIDTRSLTEFINKLKEGNGHDIEVIAWSDTQDYIERAKKYPAEKSDVLLMTDPDGAFFQQPYPSLANVVTLTAPYRIVLFPRHPMAPVYASRTVTDPVVPPSYEKLQWYTEVLRIVDQARKAHKNVVVALMEAFEKEDVTLMADLAQAIEKKDTKKIEELTQKYQDRFFFQYKTELGYEATRPVFFEFDLDLYLLLQEMTKSVLAGPEHSLVYVLDLQDTDDTSVPVIQKIDPRTYSFDDVLKMRKKTVCRDECIEITKLLAEQGNGG